MKLLTIITVLLTTSTLLAASGDKGIGFMLGNPTGLNGKYWLNDQHAVDGGFALSLGKHSNLSLHSDYLMHNDAAFYLNDIYALDLYYGLGGRMEFGDDLEIGVRVPVGLAHQIKDKNADVFAEIAPVIDFIGHTGLEMHFGVGGRYYF